MPSRNDEIGSALSAESEQLRRNLDQLRRQLAAAPLCPTDPPPRQPEPPEPPKRAQAPALDEQAWQNRSVEALQGCWSLTSDYRLENVSTGVISTVTRWRVCFDAQGRGNQDIQLSNGAQCNAPLTATFPDSQTLQIIEQRGVACSDKTTIYKREIRCARSSASSISCQTYQPETQGRDVATLQRE